MAVLLAEAVRTLGVNGPMEWYPTHLILLFVSHSFIKDLVEVLANVDNAMTYCRGRGGGVLPYISHTGTGMCPPPPSGRVFAPFWSENEYTLCPFWSGIGYGFRGNYGSV